MSDHFLLTNARIVTDSDVFFGTVAVTDGTISAIDSGLSQAPGSIDCDGDLLVPGLVELHTDNLERHILPRPKVRWNAATAVLAHDAQMATAGITTVYDAISCGDIIDGSDRLANLQHMIDGVSAMQTGGKLRAEHHLHLRCEVSSANILSLYSAFVDNPLVGIVSLMDHTPGQRQFIREDKYRDYYMGKFHFSALEMEGFTARQKENAALYSDKHRRALAADAHDRGLTLASHDDATQHHVEDAVALGVDFAEFPTTLEAAKASHERGIRVMMGAPNLVLGGSHSGNIAAGDLAQARLLDFLSSDYVPISLIHAAFLLTDRGWSLPEAIASVTAVPAAIANFSDRGVIACGKRADLVRLHLHEGVPVVRQVWRGGQQVA